MTYELFTNIQRAIYSSILINDKALNDKLEKLERETEKLKYVNAGFQNSLVFYNSKLILNNKHGKIT